MSQIPWGVAQAIKAEHKVFRPKETSSVRIYEQTRKNKMMNKIDHTKNIKPMVKKGKEMVQWILKTGMVTHPKWLTMYFEMEVSRT